MARKEQEKIEALRKRKAEIEARLQALEARARSQERKRDTRRKVLAGAMLLHLVETGRFSRDEFLGHMDGFLERDIDRSLFGLAPKKMERDQCQGKK